MGLKDLFSSRESVVLKAGLAEAEFRNELMRESLNMGSLAREDEEWARIGAAYQREFTRAALQDSCEHSRVFAVANPLIKRAISIRTVYVHGQGVGTTARGDGNDSTQDVNSVVQRWLDDTEVRAVFSGAQAAEMNERSLATDGNVFFALFTNPLTGQVKPRVIDFDEIVDKFHAPGDRMATRYYLRRYSVVDMITGREVQHEELYPDINYRPAIRQNWIGKYKVNWDTPIYHVKVNALTGWKFGIGDVYPVLPWAKGYKEFLEDWALLMKSLSRIAWKMVSKNNKDSQKKRAQIEDISKVTAGSTFSGSDGVSLEAMPKSGATIDSSSAKPLAAMVAAGMGISVVTLLADPGQEGARAVAETLDMPTRLEMQARQEVWREARRQILSYMIEQNVMAPRGELKGRIIREDDRIYGELTNPEDGTLDIVFPPLDEVPVDVIMKAISLADATGTLDPLLLAEQIMRALKIRDVDEWLAKMTDGEGKWKDPRGDAEIEAGNAATRAARNGENPAEVI